MDDILNVGEIAYSNALKCDVICVEDNYEDDDKWGCKDCIFNGEHDNCISDLYTDTFECRYNHRPDSKGVHYEKHGQN